VSKVFRDGSQPLHALDNVSLAALPGEFVTIIGPSGSGKSTLFNLITGLTSPDSGEIEIACETANGKRASRGRVGQVGYMPQRDLLLPWRTVLNNVILGPEIDGRSKREARQKARELLPLFGLDGFEHVYPETLSGGMRQRAALLRTFLTGRDVLLLDEPFGALDALTRRELQRWLLDVWRASKQSCSSHDVEEAVFLADRVLVFSPRPGRITQELRANLPRPRQSLSLSLRPAAARGRTDRGAGSGERRSLRVVSRVPCVIIGSSIGFFHRRE
jgi:ABC-type nitrate/sulfonate/bicarbonate transport system ATPase subunit